jgi:hypothetical protein
VTSASSDVNFDDYGEKKLTFLNHLLALDNVFSTKSEEQEINLVWPNLFLIFDCPTTGSFTPVHSAGYLILRNEFRSTQEIARQNIQVSFYIRSTGL